MLPQADAVEPDFGGPARGIELEPGALAAKGRRRGEGETIPAGPLCLVDVLRPVQVRRRIRDVAADPIPRMRDADGVPTHFGEGRLLDPGRYFPLSEAPSLGQSHRLTRRSSVVLDGRRLCPGGQRPRANARQDCWQSHDHQRLHLPSPVAVPVISSIDDPTMGPREPSWDIGWDIAIARTEHADPTRSR